MVKKIVLYGSECTGKTSLATLLAKHYQTIYVPEFARGFLEIKNRLTGRFKKGIVSEYEDIEPMAIGQMSAENALIAQANQYLFCDTDLMTNWIYSNYYFKKSPHWLEQAVKDRHYDLHLLLFPDIEWVSDELRDRPNQRQEMFDLFRNTLIASGRKYIEISGSYQERFEKAVKGILNSEF